MRYFICPYCKKVNTSEEWDKATINEFGEEECESIEKAVKGSVWVCPSCNKQIEIGFAEVTELVSIN